MGQATGQYIMIEFLYMGGYAGYVWSSYGIVALVLFLNVYLSLRRYKTLLRRMKRLHNEANK